MYVLARKFMGAAPALAAAALLAFNPSACVLLAGSPQLYAGDSAGAAVDVLLRARRGTDQPRDWLLWTLFGILAFYSHDFAALVLVAQAVSVLFKATPIPWRRLVTCGGLIFLFAITWPDVCLPRLAGEPAFPVDAASQRERVLASGDVLRRRRRKSCCGGRAMDRGRDCGVAQTACRCRCFLAGNADRSVGCAAGRDSRFDFAAPADVPAALPDLLAAGDDPAGGAGRGYLAEVGDRPGVGSPTLWDVADGDHQGIPRSLARTGAEPSNAVLASAAPGDAVAFFPFYSRVMLDYYRDRYGAGAPALHVFAPGYYDGGEDVRDLLKALE